MAHTHKNPLPHAPPHTPFISQLDIPKAPQTTANTAPSLKDRKERAVAELLTRFKNLVTLAAMPNEEGATKEVAAGQVLQMEVESAALVCSLSF